ncbi:hypothetical protein EX895_003368 [Sporisorium graminicola]|uniref:SUN domain-containing protein n=1 Tax=Sporisorium graminicola TaxID=280036 RepID=A0A4U7KUK1_9BASI|nr:hypothetical protein EX895_003368 [Sporisorium graminicola]TKY87787.1 hypothetical protein EX895_003368 [Sporisorium graminicola]
MASFDVVLFVILVVLTCVCPAIAPFTRLDELERIFSAPQHSSLLETLPSWDSLGHYSSEQHPSHDGTLSDILLQSLSQSEHDHQVPVAQEHRTDRPADELIAAPSLPAAALAFRELDLGERNLEIGLVKWHFYDRLKASQRDLQLRTWPYVEHLSEQELLNRLSAVLILEQRFGPWPYKIGNQEYLLYQSGAAPAFDPRTMDQTNSHTRVYFNVLRDVAQSGSGKYQFIGTFRAPDRSRVIPYRSATLEPTAVRMISIRHVYGTSSTFQLEFEPWSSYLARYRQQRALERGSGS